VARKIMIKAATSFIFHRGIKSLLQISEHGGCGEDHSPGAKRYAGSVFVRYFEGMTKPTDEDVDYSGKQSFDDHD